MRGLDAARPGTAVAYLAKEITVSMRGVVERRRRDPILLDDATERTAVVHIELAGDMQARAWPGVRDGLLTRIRDAYEERATGLQIDFDAPASYRQAYVELLQDVRASMPAGWRLSMTALGSWCLADRWLDDAPVDEVVPMLFGAGHAREQTLAAIERYGQLPEARCRESHGLAEGQPAPRLGPQPYVFGQGPWSLERAMNALDDAVPR
ncbi:MAG: hypothetical protein AAF411_02775 [Myxococcota bacterium]